jgi:hypothetical protein
MPKVKFVVIDAEAVEVEPSLEVEVCDVPRKGDLIDLFDREGKVLEVARKYSWGRDGNCQLEVIVTVVTAVGKDVQ